MQLRIRDKIAEIESLRDSMHTLNSPSERVRFTASQPMTTDHIIIVNDYAHVNGGTASIALGSAEELAKRGRRVTLFSAVGPVAPQLIGLPNLEVVCLGQPDILTDPNRLRALTSGIWNNSAARQFRSLLESCDPDHTVIHLHGWTKALSTSVVSAALEMRFPLVLTLHDFFAACPVGTFYQAQQQQICHLKPMSAACISLNCDARNYGHKLWRVGRQWVQLHAGSLPSGIRDFIAISALSDQVLRPYLPAGSQVHRVANFTSIPKADPAQVASNHRFVYSGRFSAEKGVQQFAQAGTAAGVGMLFIGDGPLRDTVEQAAPQAEFTGWLSAQNAREALRRARALVFPSLWYETQGLVVAEAAAMGIPAIVPDTSAAREWVADGETGLWFTGGDTASLQRCIQRLHEDPQFAAKLGENAYSKYWNNPSTVQRHCDELEALYATVVHAR